MQMTLTVQSHMEERKQGLNMPGGGLRIPCWHRRCRLGGRGFKKKCQPQVGQKSSKVVGTLRKGLYSGMLASCRSCTHTDVELWTFL